MNEQIDAPVYTIANNPDAGQWEVRLNESEPYGEAGDQGAGAIIGYLSYDFLDDSILLTHTVVVAKYQGFGIAGRLVKFALDEIEAEGDYSVVPVCSYVERYIEKHPEYQGLLAQTPMAPGLHLG